MSDDPSEVGLSEKQLESVRLFAMGLSYEAIGQEMGIASRTVKAHLQIARLKLGVSRSREVPYALFQRGINVYPQ